MPVGHTKTCALAIAAPVTDVTRPCTRPVTSRRIDTGTGTSTNCPPRVIAPDACPVLATPGVVARSVKDPTDAPGNENAPSTPVCVTCWGNERPDEDTCDNVTRQPRSGARVEASTTTPRTRPRASSETSSVVSSAPAVITAVARPRPAVTGSNASAATGPGLMSGTS